MENKSHVQSIRFQPKEVKKLDSIVKHHQTYINTAVGTVKVSRAAVIRTLIEQEHTKLTKEGLIKDEKN